MIRYYYNEQTNTFLRCKGHESWQKQLAKYMTGFVRLSFWQYYFPKWFPLTQQQKANTDASSTDQAVADGHQAYDPDLAVG